MHNRAHTCAVGYQKQQEETRDNPRLAEGIWDPDDARSDNPSR